MGELTKIEWCDHTFNPWIGCAKVSPGCAHCYAENNTAARTLGVHWGKGQPRRRTSPENWQKPRRWNAQAEPVSPSHPLYPVRRPRVFCASLADWLDNEVPIEWLIDLLVLIHDTPNLDWLLLTKRPQNFKPRLNAAAGKIRDDDCQSFVAGWHNGDAIPCNVRIGASVEDQPRADERIPQLVRIPALCRFLSVEPMLGPVRYSMVGIHWVIFGGESDQPGAPARLCNAEWIRNGVEQCRAAGVAPFVKQLGSHSGQVWTGLPGRNRPLKILDKKGGDPAEWPADLRVREFPN